MNGLLGGTKQRLHQGNNVLQTRDPGRCSYPSVKQRPSPPHSLFFKKISRQHLGNRGTQPCIHVLKVSLSAEKRKQAWQQQQWKNKRAERLQVWQRSTVGISDGASRHIFVTNRTTELLRLLSQKANTMCERRGERIPRESTQESRGRKEPLRSPLSPRHKLKFLFRTYFITAVEAQKGART